MKKIFFILFSFIFLFATDYKELCKKLPDKIGNFHKTGKCSGMNIDMNGIKSSQGGMYYIYENKSISIGIVSGVFAREPLLAFKQTFAIETNGQKIEKIKIKGYDSIIAYNGKNGNIAILLKDNPQTPEIMIIEFNNIDKDEVLKLIKNLSF